MSHSKRCILRQHCKAADTDSCNRMCSYYVGLHGHNGLGGRYGATNIPTEYQFITLASSPSREGQAKIYDFLTSYVGTFPRQFETDAEPIKSLYLRSHTTGTGKTTTACAIATEYLICHYIGSLRRGRQPLERPVYFLDVNSWQNDYNEFNRRNIPEHIGEVASARYYAAQKHAMEAPFVVLDDIGVRDSTEAFRGDLHRLINTRVTAGLPTVYTSNIPLADLNEVFREPSPRLVDRIRDRCAELVFTGESKRGLRR
ncbi:DNA replication protein [Paenibacillus larvae]|nr:DNA replication protein [Paenibacillus larvae]MDT2258328.1 DNA replication protein [Paenibacillus larvae]